MIPHHLVDMTTALGHKINFLNPGYTPIDKEDLYTHTRHICRYNGAIKWELVRHILLCAYLLDCQSMFWTLNADSREIQIAYAISHDFHEVYCSDVVSGMKKYLPRYQQIENSWEAYVHQQLHMPLKYRNDKLIRTVDLQALVVEMTALKHPGQVIVESKYGVKATIEELCIFDYVSKLSLDKTWEKAWKLFQVGQARIKQNGY
jgi:hypothetical protein